MVHEIPYKIVGNAKFCLRKEIKDLVAYLRLILNIDDSVSLLLIVIEVRGGIVTGAFKDRKFGVKKLSARIAPIEKI